MACGIALAFFQTPTPVDAQGRETRVGVDPVTMTREAQTVPVIGRLVARRSGPVAARIAGPIEDLKVDVGDRVTKGDVLAVLVNDTLEWEKRQREAEVGMARAATLTAKETVKLREQELKRLAGLKQSAAFSQARLEDKQQEVVMARAELGEAEVEMEVAQAALKLAEINLRYAYILAPYDGVVTRRLTETGAYVTVGGEIVTLVDEGALEIEADVPSRNIGGLLPGVQIPARFAPNTPPFQITLRAVVPDENPQTRTRAARFALPNDAAPETFPLAVNQSVTLSVPASAPRDTLTVHKDAVLSRAAGPQVFVVRDGKAVVQPVVLGNAIGNRLEVVEGLKEGDLVVVRGNERLRPGSAVVFDTPPSAASPQTPSEG